jgi:hypothetical protein
MNETAIQSGQERPFMPKTEEQTPYLDAFAVDPLRPETWRAMICPQNPRRSPQGGGHGSDPCPPGTEPGPRLPPKNQLSSPPWSGPAGQTLRLHGYHDCLGLPGLCLMAVQRREALAEVRPC